MSEQRGWSNINPPATSSAGVCGKHGVFVSYCPGCASSTTPPEAAPSSPPEKMAASERECAHGAQAASGGDSVEDMEDWFRELHDSIDVLGDCEGGERQRTRVAMQAAETIEVNYWQLLASTTAALPPPESGSSGLRGASASEVEESAWDHCRDWLLRQLTNCTDDADTLAEATGLALARAHARDLHDAVGVIASATNPEVSPSPETLSYEDLRERVTGGALRSKSAPLGDDQRSSSAEAGNGDQTKTLILEIALPEFFCDDYDFDHPEMGEILREWCEGNLTPEGLADAALEDAGLTTPRINLSLLTGFESGNFLQRMKGQLLDARIVLRVPDHELADDDRLDDYEDEWITSGTSGSAAVQESPDSSRPVSTDEEEGQ